jgi:hypothetical protein
MQWFSTPYMLTDREIMRLRAALCNFSLQKRKKTQKNASETKYLLGYYTV